MAVSALSTGAAATTQPSLANAASSKLGKQEFMQLLVTQLQNQDPLNPMDDREFISQMAQLSTLEATSNLSQNMSQLSGSQQQMQALQMVGHKVQYTASDGSTAQGQVSAVLLNSDGPSLVIGNTQVALTSVTAIQ